MLFLAIGLKQTDLDTNDAFLLDTGAHQIHVWIGKKADNEEKLHAFKMADEYIVKKSGLDLLAAMRAFKVCRHAEGAETPIFKQYFQNWKELNASVPGSKGDKPKAAARLSFNVSSIQKAAPREAYIMPDDGTGQTTVWVIKNMEMSLVEKSKIGQFYAGDSYVILYAYKVNGKDHWIIYFWQGINSSQDEVTASAIHAKELDDSLGGAPVQVRVVQNKEPPHFYLLFKGKMMVHSGGFGSGFKNRTEADEFYNGAGTRMYQVKGTNEFNVRAIQVPSKAGYLNSGDVFLVEGTNEVFTWCGKSATGDEREYAKMMKDSLVGGAKDSRMVFIFVCY